MNDSEQLLFTAWLEAAGVDIADSDYMFQERREFFQVLREVKASAWGEGYIDGCLDEQDGTPFATENPYDEEERPMSASEQDELDATTAEPKPFATDVAFEDIRKGDRVRSTVSELGVTRTNVGVAHRVEKSGNFWMAEEGGAIVANRPGATIDILERPMPILPNTPGWLIEVINGDSPGGRNISGSVLALNGFGHWWTLDGETVVEPNDIREWRLLKTVPADTEEDQ